MFREVQLFVNSDAQWFKFFSSVDRVAINDINVDSC